VPPPYAAAPTGDVCTNSCPTAEAGTPCQRRRSAAPGALPPAPVADDTEKRLDALRPSTFAFASISAEHALERVVPSARPPSCCPRPTGVATSRGGRAGSRCFSARRPFALEGGEPVVPRCNARVHHRLCHGRCFATARCPRDGRHHPELIAEAARQARDRLRQVRCPVDDMFPVRSTPRCWYD